MKPISVELQVSAPPTRVFEVFTDLPRAPERVRGIQSLQVLTPGPVGLGTRFRETRVMFGRESSETMEIVEFRPGRFYAVGAESCGLRYRSNFTFDPEGGGTQVRVTFQGTAVSLAAKILAPLMGFMAGACRKALEADCADLKAFCEKTG